MFHHRGDLVLFRPLSFLLLILFVLFAAAIGYSQASTNIPPQVVSPGETIVRKTQGGQKNEFSVECRENSYARLTIDQQGVDIGARFMGPENTPVLDFDGDPRNSGEEIVEFVCSSAGPVIFSVDARQRGAAPGTFVLNFRELRPATEKDKAHRILDLTSLTVEEFEQLVEPFEQAFVRHMQQWTMEGKPRRARAYTSYANSPLPTPEDRLLFILSYLKVAALQVAHGALFGMSQSNANKWIHVLLPVLDQTLHDLGEAPSRHLQALHGLPLT